VLCFFVTNFAVLSAAEFLQFNAGFMDEFCLYTFIVCVSVLGSVEYDILFIE
jgi:hypothetical protein